MKFLLQNANIISGKLNAKGEMSVLNNASIAIENDKITGVYTSQVTDTQDYQVIDLEGKYVMPGMINLHVHLAASGKPPKANAKPKDYKALFDKLSKYKFIMNIFGKMGQKLALNHLKSGVTTIRAVGGILDLDGQARDLIKSGKLTGPRIISCNTAVSVPGGHFAGSLATEAHDPEEAVRHVDMIHATHPDWIKLMITGGVMDASAEGEPGVLKMDPAIVKAACDRAHELGYKVAAHVESPEGVRVALENGVDTIEHGAVPDEHMIELFKKNSAACVCTISPALPYVDLPEEISHCGDLGRKNGKIVLNGIIECARVCLENGIPVGLGTDAGCNFITPDGFWREVYYFTRYLKVSNDFALYSATMGNAAILGMDDRIGSIEEGKLADLAVYDSNPLEDVRNLRECRMVIANGRIVKDTAIKKNKYIEKVLDSLMAD